MRLSRTLISILVITLIIFGSFGIVHSVAMMSSFAASEMAGCPLLGYATALCPMNILEHLNAWQNLFASVVTQNIIALLSSLLSLFFLFRNTRIAHMAGQPRRAYAPRKFAIPHSDRLSRFIARGLLNPKIF